MGNINWIDWVKYEELPKYINGADVCLGIFGDTEKATRVIPNKAFQIIASGKPLITGDSPAARELFRNKETAVLCKMASAEAVADAILLLKQDNCLRDKIAQAGHILFKDTCNTKAIGKELSGLLEIPS